MIVAGIDEAGLGPALGPLCTAGAAFRLPARADAATPWEIYRGIIGREKKDRLPLVHDSKIVYTSRGLGGLELPVLAFMRQTRAAGGKIPPGRDALLKTLGAGIPEADCAPWTGEADWALPRDADAAAVDALYQGIKAIPEARLLAFSARVRTAKALNRDFASGLNKSETAWRPVASLLREFASLEPNQEETLIVVDKQGGRNFYAGMLAEAFDCPLVATIKESADYSEYRIGNCRFVFQPRADRGAFPVALASMLAKYLRERFMEDLNRWFAREIPGLKPTAGYHGDAPRFYGQVKPVLQKHKIGIGDFWRQR